MNEYGTKMGNDAAAVLHGFLALSNKDKMKVVEAMNEYFDSSEKGRIRAKYDEQFESLDLIGKGAECICCGRK